MTVSIHMDKKAVSAVAARTDTYKSLPNKLKPAMEQIADLVREEMIPAVFTREGPGWKNLAKRTVRERRAQGYGGQHPILQRTKDLYKELTEKNHPQHIEVIRVGKRSRIEIGGSSQKFMENQLGKRSQRLPARPMIPGTGTIRIDSRYKNQMLRIIEKTYQKSLNKPS